MPAVLLFRHAPFSANPITSFPQIPRCITTTYHCPLRLGVFLLYLTPHQTQSISMVAQQIYNPCNRVTHRASFQLALRPALYSMLMLPTFYADLREAPRKPVPAALVSVMPLRPVGLSLSRFPTGSLRPARSPCTSRSGASSACLQARARCQ